MYSHSEILEILDEHWPQQQAQTDIDILHLESQGEGRRQILEWKQHLDDASILPYLPLKDPINQSLRIFFMTSKQKPHVRHPSGKNRTSGELHIRRATFEWFCIYYQISALFVEGVLQANPWGKTGNAIFIRRDAAQVTTIIAGHYQYLNGWRQGLMNVWFSYNIKTGSSAYLLIDCPQDSKDCILRRAREEPFTVLNCPFVIDMLIAKGCAFSWQSRIGELRNELINWEESGEEKNHLQSLIHAPQGTQRLHNLSRLFHIMTGDLNDFEERLDFLIEVGKTYKSLITSEVPLTDSAIETLVYFKSRNSIWKRWVANYTERTKIMMNLLFSIASQVDSRTNLEIANLTSKIAMEAKRDSSSMITIAAVTMVFLPGTFISAIFSMVFFDTGTNSNGRTTLTVAPQWWIFPTITIPLTVLVFAVWQWWWRKREAGSGPIDSKLTTPGAETVEVDDTF